MFQDDPGSDDVSKIVSSLSLKILLLAYAHKFLNII